MVPRFVHSSRRFLSAVLVSSFSLAAALSLLSCGDSRSVPGAGKSASDSSLHGDSARAAQTGTPQRSLTRGKVDSVVDKPLRTTPEFATIVMRTTATQNEKITETHYLDRHGERQAIYTDIETTVDEVVADGTNPKGSGKGGKSKKLTIQNVNIMENGIGTLYDPKRKVGMRNPLESGTLGNLPDFTNLTAERKAALSYKSIDPMSVLGHQCQGHAFSRNGLSLRVWTWEGIALRTEIDYGPGNRSVTEAISIDTTTAIKESLFVVPEDVRFEDK